jgi:Fe2+ transport system protein FeoA
LKSWPFAPSLTLVKKNSTTPACALKCAEPASCPLNRLREGTTARVVRLASTPELNLRLREMGVFEDQHVKMLSHPSNIICQVCNTRLALSDELAKVIWVEPLHPKPTPARP